MMSNMAENSIPQSYMKMVPINERYYWMHITFQCLLIRGDYWVELVGISLSLYFFNINILSFVDNGKNHFSITLQICHIPSQNLTFNRQYIMCLLLHNYQDCLEGIRHLVSLYLISTITLHSTNIFKVGLPTIFLIYQFRRIVVRELPYYLIFTCTFLYETAP